MARVPRIDVGGNVYHVLNRANAKKRIFNIEKDYKLFEEIVEEGVLRKEIKILAYCVMPNHWHFVCATSFDGQLSDWMKWVSQKHTQNWHVVNNSVGTGHLYQGRYKSFPVQTNQYLLQVLRYVEQNPLQAGLVAKAQDWKWGSLWRRENGSDKEKRMLSEWPIDYPTNYSDLVNSIDVREASIIELHEKRNISYGEEGWFKNINQKNITT